MHLIHIHKSPSYLKDIVTPTASVSCRGRLRSASSSRYEQPRMRLRFGLELDMRNLSLGRRHLVNAYEVEEGIGVLQVTLCDPCLSALSVRYYKKRAIKIHLPLPLPSVSAVSYTLHQLPGTLYRHRHHCNNSLTLTHLNSS